jgi:hypothetical protein
MDCHLNVGSFVVKLSSNVDVGSAGSHSSTGNETSFDELVRIVAHNFTIFASAWLAFVGVNHKIARPAV